MQNLESSYLIINNNYYRDNNVNYISIADVDLLVSYFDSDRDNILPSA